MSPERWKQIEEVFQAALDLPEGERVQYISATCAGDEELREQVEALVSQHDEAGDFIETPAVVSSGFRVSTDPRATNPMTGSLDDDPAIGRRLGAYKIVRELGRGGMGAVYMAERADSEFRRSVAIKLIKRGMDTDFILRRFRNERQILATLDHPHIAKLLDGGTTEEGLPYFVMEYIEGKPIYQYCDERRLTVAERLRLFAQVCDAVHYAHRSHVIHRDIKPSNIMVTPAGVPKLLDFGIAKVLNPEMAADITLDPTGTAMLLMTPEYAAPEQVCGQLITPATDVYSLGVLLYELLTGHRPYRLVHRSPHEIARVICEEEPVLPSEVVSDHEGLIDTRPRDNGDGGAVTFERVLGTRRATIETLRPQLAGDLDAVVMKALSKEPERRYQSAEELRADILNHLEGRTVSAPWQSSGAARDARLARGTGESPTAEVSLAVLPLKLLGASREDDEYLGVGLADSLITRLSQSRRLVVRPTSSSARFRDSEADPFAAGRELGADFILDGRIRRAGDSIRVTMQLLDVRAGTTLWAGQFDEKFTDVLRLEDAITSQVAEAIVPRLTTEERSRLAKRGTESPEAYEAYLRGRYHWNTFGEDSYTKALVFYERAVERDPNFALAHAGIADYYNMLGSYGVLPFAESSRQAKEAALTAVGLDESLAEGYAALGFATLMHDFDWAGAEAHLLRALELNPNYATGHLWYGYFLTLAGRAPEAFKHARRAVELDPLAPVLRHSVNWIYYLSRSYEEAIAFALRMASDEPQHALAYVLLCLAFSRTGRHEEAIEYGQRSARILGRTPYTLTRLASAYARAGRHAEARAVLAEVEAMAATRYVSPHLLAAVYCALGDTEGSFAQLDRAMEIRDARVMWLGVDPLFDALRDDPRYEEILRRTNNPAPRGVGRQTGELSFDEWLPAGERGTGEPRADERALAVLPFKVLNAAKDKDAKDKDNDTGGDYLGVGLADALITRLSNVQRFVVRPTNTVLRYGGAQTDAFAAGRELGVAFVLDGHVQRAGDSIRVSVQLLDVEERTTVWAASFDENFTDVFGIQDAISTKVAEALVPRLTGDERARLHKRGTDNTEAFEAYLRGRYHLNLLTPENINAAITHFERAVTLDPAYALAYSALADCYFCLTAYASSAPGECAESARRMAERAIALDDTLGEAYTVLGFVTYYYRLDAAEADRLLRRGLELSPNYAAGRIWYSVPLAARGDFDGAVAESVKAVELDPSPFSRGHLAWMLYQVRRTEEALEQARKVVESTPNFGHVRGIYGWILRRAGRLDEAIEQGRRAVELSSGTPWLIASLASSYARARRTQEARALLRQLEEAATRSHVSPFNLALVHLNLSDRERAFELLEEAVTVRDGWIVWLAVEPELDALRSDPRYAALLRRMNAAQQPAPPEPRPAVAAATQFESPTGEKSVAVLPLQVLKSSASDDTGDEYLGVGLADALVARLSAVRRFVVRPTSSVLRYGGDVDPLEAGRALGVDYVVTGTIRRAGTSIRVSAQLLDVREGATRWARKFDAKSGDVLHLEDTLSEQVAAALVPHLTGEEQRELSKRGTESPEAYEAYLRGRFYWNTFTEEGFAKALVSYSRAIAIDPTYAAPYGGIADYYNWLGVYGVMPFAECSAAAKEAARKAVELDPTSAEAYTALGFATVTHDFDWTSAERQHLRAIELNPKYATAHQWYGFHLAMEARFDEAVSEMLRARALDPLTPSIMQALGWCYYQARRHDDALNAYRRLLEIEPNFAYGLATYSWTLRSVGEHEEAVRMMQKAVAISGGGQFFQTNLAAAYAAAGREAEAREILAQLEEVAATHYVSPYHLAIIHLRLGERERALSLLEQAYATGDGWLVWLGVEPELDALRDDPRFENLLRRTNNPTSARRAPAAATTRAADQTTATPRMSEDEEARQLYQAARYFATKRTAEGLRQAIERLERAVERDPKFALAHAELADCNALLNWYVEPPPAGAWARAKESALAAVAADDTLAVAHASLGFIKSHYDRDWAGAEAELRRAVELDPQNPVARRWHAFNLSAMGRHEEALSEIRLAQELSPRSPVIATGVANILFLACRFDEAAEQCRKALELDPGSIAAHVVMRWAYEKKGLREEALAVFEQERAFAGDTPTTRAKRAHVLAACGRRDEAREILTDLLARRDDEWITAYEIAIVHSLLGERDEAFRWLARAESEHAVGFAFVAVDPHLDALHDDPRFKELLRRLGNPAA
jgi:TolB-like protein/Flp pilus assembly protein TadD